VSKPDVMALIPARGGSKSVPRKNLLSVAGRPLIAYSIMHAQACPLITRVVVSTGRRRDRGGGPKIRRRGAVPAPGRGCLGHRH